MFFLSHWTLTNLFASISPGNQAFNIVSQRNTLSTVRDSAAMRTIAFVTLIFLPATFVSAIFSTSFFDFSPSNRSEGSSSSPSSSSSQKTSDSSSPWVISSKFWIYWAFAIPLTAVTVLAWYLWHRWVVLPESLVGEHHRYPRHSRTGSQNQRVGQSPSITQSSTFEMDNNKGFNNNKNNLRTKFDFFISNNLPFSTSPQKSSSAAIKRATAMNTENLHSRDLDMDMDNEPEARGKQMEMGMVGRRKAGERGGGAAKFKLKTRRTLNRLLTDPV